MVPALHPYLRRPLLWRADHCVCPSISFEGLSCLWRVALADENEAVAGDAIGLINRVHQNLDVNYNEDIDGGIDGALTATSEYFSDKAEEKNGLQLRQHIKFRARRRSSSRCRQKLSNNRILEKVRHQYVDMCMAELDRMAFNQTTAYSSSANFKTSAHTSAVPIVPAALPAPSELPLFSSKRDISQSPSRLFLSSPFIFDVLVLAI